MTAQLAREDPGLHFFEHEVSPHDGKREKRWSCYNMEAKAGFVRSDGERLHPSFSSHLYNVRPQSHARRRVISWRVAVLLLVLFAMAVIQWWNVGIFAGNIAFAAE